MFAAVRSGIPTTPDINRFLDVVENGSCAMTFEFPNHLGDGSPEIDCVRMGDVNVLRYQGSGLQQCWRLREHIARDRMEYFIVSMPLSSHYNLRYGGVSKKAPPDSFVFLSTARPFQCSINEMDFRSSFSALNVRVPAPLVRQRVPRIDELCGEFVDITPGAARAMQTSFHTALADGPFMNEHETQSLGGAMMELICSAAANVLGSQVGCSNFASIQEQILWKAKAFVEANLSNQDLAPRLVADHCRVSTRYLHTVFTSLHEGLSCFCYIREMRLQRCREALRNHDLRNRYIADIAADWGFCDPASFTHLYKAKFGCTPGQDRK